MREFGGDGARQAEAHRGHPFVIRKVRGSCTVHWAGYLVRVRAYVEREYASLGVTSRTTSMASWAAK